MMDYGNVLNRSWGVVWNHKFMIVLGFLAALGGGFGSRSFNYSMDSSDIQNLPFADAPFASSNFQEMLPVIGAFAAGALCLGIIVAIALWVLRLTAEAGLIDAASRLDAGQSVSFSAAMSAGWGHIWRMIGLSLLLFGGIFLLVIATILVGFLIAGTSIAAADSTDIGGLIAAVGVGLVAVICCLVCGLVLLSILASILYIFAQRAIVLEGLGVMDGLRRAWQVIRENLGEVFILLVIFFLLGAVVSAIVAAIFIPLGAISFGPGALRLFSGEALSGLDIFLMVVGGLLIVFVIAAIRSFFVAFSSSAYTLAFQEFTDKKAASLE